MNGLPALDDTARATGAPPPASHAHAIETQVLTSFGPLQAEADDWDAAVLRAQGSVYMTFDWVNAWWSTYGAAADLRVFVFRQGGRIFAVLPLYIDTVGLPPLGCRIARLVGANVPPKVFDPPIPAEYAAQVLDAVFLHLFERDRCDVLSLGPASVLQPWLEAIDTAVADTAGRVVIDSIEPGVHSVFHLPVDMEAYFASLSKNERKHRRKYELRLLSKEFPDTHVDVVHDPALCAEEFEAFARLHRLQWRAEGKTGHFGAWPNGLAFNRALVAAQASRGRLRFVRIVAGGRTVASQYVFVFGDRYYWELPARVVDPAWERFSLGPTGIVTMLGQAIAEGMACVEGGLAHYDYKVRLGATEYDTRTYRLASARTASRLRVWVVSWVRRAASVLYHKVWYRRVAPRLPQVFWRPQARWWLRLDF